MTTTIFIKRVSTILEEYKEKGSSDINKIVFFCVKMELMKKVIQGLFIFLMMILTMNVFAQDRSFAIESGAEISLEKEVHHQGTIKQGVNGICHIKFENTGTKVLEISSIDASEGCKVISAPQKPIPAGKKGMITVKYDTNNPGDLEQSVTINSNSTESKAKVIRIKGNVEGTAIPKAIPVKIEVEAEKLVETEKTLPAEMTAKGGERKVNVRVDKTKKKRKRKKRGRKNNK